MFYRTLLTVAFAAICLALRLSPLDAQQALPAAPPVRQVDHIMIRADDPTKLYAFFTETLRLPSAWSLATRGVALSGGVGFGNVNVEVIHIPDQKPSQAVLVGFALEPSPLADCLQELTRRGIPYAQPRPLVRTEPDGSKTTLWTNVPLLQFSDSDRPANANIYIFVSEYGPAYVNVAERRARLRRELLDSDGGLLGVRSVEEIIVGVTDLNAAGALWQSLLDPLPPSAPGLWRVGEGPAIRLVQAQENRLQGLVVGVRSLGAAESFLRHRALLGPVSDSGVMIDQTKVDGLTIRLIERQ
jgi:hypothetical protein